MSKEKKRPIEFEMRGNVLKYVFGDEEKIVLPETVNEIDSTAFVLCDNLREIVVHKSVTVIAPHAFPQGIASVIIDKDNPVYESVGKNVVAEKSTHRLFFAGVGSTIPSGVKIIGEGSLYSRKDLTELVIPDGVVELEKSICDGAKNIRRVVIPASLTKIAQGAFVNADGVTEFVVDKANPRYTADGGCLIEKDTATVIRACAGCVIPEYITHIGKHAFGGGITELHFPSSVESGIEKAFCCASELQKLTVAEDNKIYRSENNCIIKRANGLLVRGCGTSVIPEGVTEIGAYAFENSSALTRVTLPHGVKRIQESAFCACVNIEEIVMPETLERIEPYAFMICDKIKEFKLPQSLKIIEGYAFGYCSGLEKVVIPRGVVRIGEEAFHECENLAELDFEDEVGWVCEEIPVEADELHGQAAIDLLNEGSELIKVIDEKA